MVGELIKRLDNLFVLAKLLHEREDFRGSALVIEEISTISDELLSLKEDMENDRLQKLGNH